EIAGDDHEINVALNGMALDDFVPGAEEVARAVWQIISFNAEVNVCDVKKSCHALSARRNDSSESLFVKRDRSDRAPGFRSSSDGDECQRPFDYTDGARASATKFGDRFRRGHNLW